MISRQRAKTGGQLSAAAVTQLIGVQLHGKPQFDRALKKR